MNRNHHYIDIFGVVRPLGSQGRRRVIIESPFAGDVDDNIKYARSCVAHSLSIGEAPLASHLLYTQIGVLDDKDPTQRERGMAAGFTWYDVAEACVVYTDKGISPGMQRGILEAELRDIEVEFRTLSIPASS